MRYPEFIKKGDKIVVTALSRGTLKSDKARKERYLKGASNLEEAGFRVEMQEHCFKERMSRSASAKIRGHKFNEAYFDEESKMVLNLAGGDYQYETMPYINYKRIKDSTPKWVQGYSDTTHITFLLPTLCDVASVYGEGMGGFATHYLSDEAKNNLKLLKGEELIQYSYDMYDEIENKEDPLALPEYAKKVEWKTLSKEKEVTIKGRLIGGCLDVVHTLVGTKYDKVRKFINKYKDDGIIWFLETYNADSYTLAGQLNQLKNAGYFKHCKGIVFGRPLFYDGGYHKIEYYKVVKSVLGKLNVPIIYDADIGHVKPMISLVCGSITTFNYKESKCEIITELK